MALEKVLKRESRVQQKSQATGMKLSTTAAPNQGVSGQGSIQHNILLYSCTMNVEEGIWLKYMLINWE